MMPVSEALVLNMLIIMVTHSFDPVFIYQLTLNPWKLFSGKFYTKPSEANYWKKMSWNTDSFITVFVAYCSNEANQINRKVESTFINWTIAMGEYCHSMAVLKSSHQSLQWLTLSLNS